MKDSFDKIYFDLIMESNKNLVQEGKLSNSVLAGIAGLGITGGALFGLNKAADQSYQKFLERYNKSEFQQDSSYDNYKKDKDVSKSSDDDKNKVNEIPIDEDDDTGITSEEEFIAKVIYCETSYKATYEEILMLCQIISNRINNKEFGNGADALEVVMVKNAFSCINDPNNLNWIEFEPDLNSRTKLCCKLAKKLLQGKKDFFDDKDIVYYHDNSISTPQKWTNKYWRPVRLYKTKNFQFYKIVSNVKK